MFDSGVVKLQRGEALSSQEARTVEIFKKVDDGEPVDESNMSFVERMLYSQDEVNKRRKVVAQHHSTLHVSPTSNICERLFSRAKLVMRPHRRLMDMSTLETLLMLRMNKDHWNVNDIQNVINKAAADRKNSIAAALARHAREGAESSEEEER